MDGPERLEDDARPARRATWLVGAVVVLAVAALGAVRLTGDSPGPDPSLPPGPPPASTERQLAGWPEDIAVGTLYVLDGFGVASVDVSRGLVQRSALRLDASRARLAPAGEGVLAWFAEGDGSPHLVTAASKGTPTVGPGLSGARRVLPGPGGVDVWTSVNAGPLDGAPQLWRRLAPDDTVQGTVRLRGPVREDGAGGLFAELDGRVVHVPDGEPTTTWRGEVGAVGRSGWETRRCDGRSCSSVLHDRSSGAETPLGRITTSAFQTPVLSDDNRFDASLQAPTDADDRLVVRVAVPGQERELRSFPAASGGRAALVWLSDRWLVSTDDAGLVLYDAVDDRLVPVRSEFDAASGLVLRA